MHLRKIFKERKTFCFFNNIIWCIIAIKIFAARNLQDKKQVLFYDWLKVHFERWNTIEF
jgi:hypothetical protein